MTRQSQLRLSLRAFLLSAVLFSALTATALPARLDGQYVRDWLVLAPLSLSDADARRDNSPLAIDEVQPAEAAVVTTPSGARLRWSRLETEGPVLDLSGVLGADSRASVLLSTEILSDAATSARIVLAAEAPAIMGLNGSWTAMRNVPTAFRLDSTAPRFSFQPGANRLLLLITRTHPGRTRIALRTEDPGKAATVSASTLDASEYGGVFLRPPQIRMRVGDDSAWKEFGCPDEAWKSTDLLGLPDGAKPLEEHGGVVWFRFPLHFTPDMLGRRVFFECYPFISPLEIFLDGEPVPGPQLMKPPYDFAPAAFSVQHLDSLVALRWTVTPNTLHYEGRDFAVLLRDHAKGLDQYRSGEAVEQSYAIHRLAIIALFAATLLFHATLFIYYPKRQENLFSALTLFACLAAMISLHISEITTDQALWHFCYYILFLGFTSLSIVCGLGLFQVKLTGHLPRTFYLYLAMGLAAYGLALRYGNFYVHAFPLLTIPEVARVFWASRRQGRAEITLLAALSVFVLGTVVFNALGSIYEWHERSGFLRYLPWYIFAIFIQAMLVMLAREFGGAMTKIEQFAASLESEVSQRTSELDSEIRAHQQTEKSLRESLALLRATIESTVNGIMVLDHAGEILVCNRRMAELWELPSNWTALPAGGERQELFAGSASDPRAATQMIARLLSPSPDTVHEVIALRSGRILDCSAGPYQMDGTVAGRLLVFEDETERRRQEETRERLFHELSESLSQVKTLQGLLPICAWCKKIRDDSGYWSQLEVYLSSHSELEFSHGICPECAAKLDEGRTD